MYVFSWIVWFYKAEALFHIQSIKVSAIELVDVTEDIEGMYELCKHWCYCQHCNTV